MQNDAVYLGRDTELAGLKLLHAGKVRDIYEYDADHLLFVISDRVSAFDVLMAEGIPHKGRVLNTIAAWWFEQTRDLIPNHMVSTSLDCLSGLDAKTTELLEGRTMLVRRAKPTSVEWVVRGYIVGSGWKEYQAKGTVCSIPLPAGLEFCQRLPEAILTPTTKDEVHDMPLSPEEARELVGDEVFEQLRDASLSLFQRGTDVLNEIDILLADTKFEFGEIDGKLVLIDEALTPDSSRFWPKAEYATGKNQPSFDKQILRDYLETLTWDKEPPAPVLPAELLSRISARYLEVCEKITGSVPNGVPV
ncbi:MAG: phosphoribosylaminoimidazole-succinocarboxamide synthase [Planctomycetota bacterium]|jgi:phosphoribosylaminoimidazole-succinocarboxamide synthase